MDILSIQTGFLGGKSQSAAAYALACDSGAFLLTGYDVSLLKQAAVQSYGGILFIPGVGNAPPEIYRPVLLNKYTLWAESGSFLIQGGDVQLLKNTRLALGMVRYYANGQAVVLRANRKISGKERIFLINGKATFSSNWGRLEDMELLLAYMNYIQKAA